MAETAPLPEGVTPAIDRPSPGRCGVFKPGDCIRLHAERDDLRAALSSERARADAAQREAERRADCHGGPGMAQPACGGCATCLTRVLEAAESRADRLAALEDAILRLSEEVDAKAHGVLMRPPHPAGWNALREFAKRLRGLASLPSGPLMPATPTPTGEKD